MIANDLETDLNSRPKYKPPQPTAPAGPPHREAPPRFNYNQLPHCHYCPAKHFHRDCPELAEEETAGKRRYWRDSDSTPPARKVGVHYTNDEVQDPQRQPRRSPPQLQAITVTEPASQSFLGHATVDPASVTKPPSNITEEPLLFSADEDSPRNRAGTPCASTTQPSLMTVSLTTDRSPTRHATVDPASVAKSPSNVTEDPLLFPADRDSPQHSAAAPLLARERTASPADDERVIDHQPGEEHATVTHTHPAPTGIAVMDGVTNTALAAVDDQVTNTAPAAVSHQVTITDPAAVNQPVTNTAPAAVSHQVTNTALAAVTDKVTNTAAPVVNNHITSPPPSQAPNLAVIQIDGQTLPRSR
ncbi:soluble scavenger receptor cysteine-rich domain-containing protein SSC5D-like [Nilaparvata lugens]|uniref:soluble scavenger receptor cysteine-rich domain-containing protein SSC5D-like n=1 Tax=Nilaparvata lugens TaxID=108931 RepID=UPI00193E7A06|nr:soluble scavenger receptor cysteine-rich domain-containing protein SSC5D-like [Nilaparvata lugens]